MEKKKTLKSALMAGTIFAGSLLGAGEAPQQDNRNTFEKGVHATTSFVDTALHATTETILLPVRGVSWILSETGRQAYNGLNYVGNKTGVVGTMLTKPIGKTINAVLRTTGSALDSAATMTQTAVKYPVAMAGAALDAGATATRDGEEAVRRFGKESLILTSGAALGTITQPIGLADSTITELQDIARTTVKGVADTTAAGVGLINEDAGQKLQENIEVTNGAIIGVQTADAIARGLATGLPIAASMVAPLANEDIRGMTVDGIIQQVQNTQPQEKKEISELVPEIVKPVVEEAQKMGKEPTPSNLKNLLKTLSKTAEDASNQHIEMAPAPQYNPLSENRDGVKKIVQASEVYRATKGR